MTVKYVKSGNDFRVYIVESYRVSGESSPKSRTLMKLGLLSELKKEHENVEEYLDNVLASLSNEKEKQRESADAEISSVLSEVDYTDASYAKEYHIGHMLLKKVWDELSLPYFFRYYCSKMMGGGADIERAAFAFCAEAFSELGPQRDVWKRDKCFIENDIAEFGNAMKMLDIFDAVRDKLASFIDKKANLRERSSIDFVHVFPCVFECESSQGGSLKYSETPVMCYMRAGKEGMVYSGDVSVGASKIAEEYLDKDEKDENTNTVFVSNRFAPEYNDLIRIRENGHGYITYNRIKTLPRSIQNDMLASENYVTLNSDFKYKVRTKSEEIRYNMQDVLLEEKYIYTFSQKRFKKERSDRLLLSARQLPFATEMLKNHNTADENDSDKQFDGYRCIRSSGCRMVNSDIIDVCRYCARLEDYIRSVRGVVEARQNVAWNTKRIRGFFAFAFLVVRLLNLIEIKISRAGEGKISYDRIVSAINDARVIPMDKNGRVWKSTNISEDFRQISDALGVEMLPDICSAQTLKKLSSFSIRL